MEDINFIMDVAKEAMEKSLDLDKAFINIRAGKANPAMLSSENGVLWNANPTEPGCKHQYPRCANLIRSAMGQNTNS